MATDKPLWLSIQPSCTIIQSSAVVVSLGVGCLELVSPPGQVLGQELEQAAAVEPPAPTT